MEIPWRRAWQPTPVFLPGESPWTEQPGRLQSIGHRKSGTTERLSTALGLSLLFFQGVSIFSFHAAVTICSDFGAQENKVSHCFRCFPIYLLLGNGTRYHDLRFFEMLSFKPAFPLSSFTFIKRLFSSSLLSTVRMVPSTYLKLLIFLLAILIPDCASFSPAFHMIHCACKLNKQGDNIQP